MPGRITFQREKVLSDAKTSNNLVFEGTFDDNPCAVKRVIKPSGEVRSKLIKDVKQEMKIWFDLSQASNEIHLPIVRQLGYEDDLDFWYMAAEKYEGNLAQLIQRSVPFTTVDSLTIDQKFQLTLQAANGLAFVHEKGFVHKDIKPSNFVVRLEGGKWVCKLTDFGFSKEKVEGASHCSRTFRFGTPRWIAPELLETNQQPGQLDSSMTFSWRSDVWSMGLVIHFILTDGIHNYGWINNNPLQGREMLQQISQSQIRVNELVDWMLNNDPNKRPTMQQVVETIQNWQLVAVPSVSYFEES